LARTKLLFVILVICLTLVIVYLLTDYLRAQGAKNSLINQVDNTTGTLMLMAAPPEDLPVLLEQARAENQSARLFVSGNDLDVTKVIDSLLNTAAECNLKVNPVSTEQWIKRSIRSGTYDMLPIELTVAGGQADFVRFLADLENRQLFPSLVIEEIEITHRSRAGTDMLSEVTVKLNLSLVIRSEVKS
jgi:hypothetical protein